MRKTSGAKKLSFSIVALIFVLAATGCQPTGGELLPIGGGAISLGTSRFENDTAVISNGGLRLKLYGTWDGRAKVRLIVENDSPNSVRVNFAKSVVLDSGGGNIKIDSIREDKGDSSIEIKDGQFTAAAGGKHKLVFGFPLDLTNSLGQEPPRTISIVLATEAVSQSPQTTEHRIDFKGIENKVSVGKADPKDW